MNHNSCLCHFWYSTFSVKDYGQLRSSAAFHDIFPIKLLCIHEVLLSDDFINKLEKHWVENILLVKTLKEMFMKQKNKINIFIEWAELPSAVPMCIWTVLF